MRGPSCGEASHAVRGPGAHPAGSARLLRRFSCRGRGGPSPTTRSWQPVPERRLQAEIGFLGMESSPAFVRQPEGNGCVERFIRTLKEQLLWVRTFRTVEELRQALAEFRERYNQRWIVQRHNYLTPEQARQQLLAQGAAALKTSVH